MYYVNTSRWGDNVRFATHEELEEGIRELCRLNNYEFPAEGLEKDEDFEVYDSAEIIVDGVNWNADEIADMDNEEFADNFGGIWEQIGEGMDSELREELHSAMAPCSEKAFLVEYLRRAVEDMRF